MNYVYHFTDTMRLPWILDSRELRPGTASKFKFEGLPGLDFVWATTNEHRARSAAAFWDNTRYQDGEVCAIRLTLSADDFEPWPEATKRFPEWTDDHIKRFNETSQGDNPADWRTHIGSLGRPKWLAIHARGYLEPWREVPLDLAVCTSPHPTKGLPVKSILFGGHAFSSMRTSKNPVCYEYRMVDVEEGSMTRAA
jgi:hypothetical protein